MINMNIKSPEKILKNNYINENHQATQNKCFVPIYENYHLEPYFYNNRLNQNNINECPPIINEQNLQQQLNRNQKVNGKIILNQFDFTKASTKPDKSFDNNIADNEFIPNNEIYCYGNTDNQDIERYYYEKLKKNLMPKKKFLGRKKKFQLIQSNHNKYSKDNLQRKCKSLVLNCSLEYLNYHIKRIYEGNIGDGICIKQLLDINQDQKADNTILFNKKFLNKTLKEIFSTDISTKYTSFLPEHNTKLIKRMLNDKDEIRRNKFIKIFNLTFSDCIKKFLGIDNSLESEGFQTFDIIKNKLDEENTYLEEMKKFLMNFEEILKNKKPRNNKTKEKNKKKRKNGTFQENKEKYLKIKEET